MVQTLSINFERPIPVFPLSSSVLLPHVALPLHIFEPRYLQMTKEALDSHGLIAMAVFEHTPSEQEYQHGRPPLKPHVCLGYIAQYNPLENGRYLLLLQGVCRAKLVDEIDHEPYRMAHLSPIDIEPADDEQLAEIRHRLEALVLTSDFDDVDGIDELRQILSQDTPTFAVIDLAAMTFCRADAERMYTVLADPDAASRGRWLIEQLEHHQDD